MKTCEYKVAHQLIRQDGSSYYAIFETFDTKTKARLWIEREHRSGDPAIVILKVESKVVWRPNATEVDTP